MQSRELMQRRFNGWATLGALTLALPLLGGCYTHTRIPVERAPIGQDLRLVVTSEGATELQTFADTNEPAPTIIGKLEGREGDEMLMRVPLPRDPNTGTRSVAIGQLVRVPMGEVLAADIRTLDRPKTGLLGAALTGAATLIVLQIIDAGRGNPEGENPDPDILFTLLRIPIG